MKQKKDILFLCQYFYPEYNSSATLPYDTAIALVKAGFHVSALCGYPKEYMNLKEVPIKEIHEGIRINRIKYLQLKRSNFIYRLINYFSFSFAVFLRFFKLKRYKAIIVYSNPPILPFIAAMVNKIYGTKMIFVSYDVYPEIAIVTNVISEKSIINKMMKLFNKVIFKQVDKVVALSNEMKEYLLKYRPLLDEDKVDVIPNWYEDKEMKDISTSYKNNMFEDIEPRRSFIVSYFGNMGTAQDLETIISAMKNFKHDGNVKFLFIGHGNKMENLRNMVEVESLDNVRIFDFIHGEDFQDALNISECFIVSLEKGLTGLAVPSKTYSYMMAGKPIIAIMGKGSDIAKDLIQNKAGYSIGVGEVDKLIDAINELKRDKEKAILMGKRSREVFLKKYTTKICTGKYVHMIKEMLGGRTMLKNKILLITGGTGSFGNAVMERFLDTQVEEIRIFSRDEKKQDDMRKKYKNTKLKFYLGDVRDISSIKNAMYGVDYVFHAAALKQVPSCEFFPLEAVKTNILGTNNVLTAAVDMGVKKVICLSTDKAVYPINAMGISKAMMERVIIAKAKTINPENTLICCTRYGNVMASRGSVIPLFIEQIKSGEDLTITDPSMTRFLMNLSDAVELVAFAFENANPGDIMVQKSPAATIGDLAQALKELFNANNEIKIIGIRHGEKQYESLLTKEEYLSTEDMGRFYRVPSDKRDLNYDKYFIEGNESLPTEKEYNSNNTDRLNIEEIKEKLLQVDYVKEELKGWNKS